MLTNKPRAKILVDGGDPDETLGVKKLLGFVDGQTTNPSLVAKNPEIQQRIASGDTLSPKEEKEEYRKIVQAISPLVGDAINRGFCGPRHQCRGNARSGQGNVHLDS